MKIGYFNKLLACCLIIIAIVSCIDDNNANCIMCYVSVSSKDSTGKVLPLNLMINLRAYLFKNGKFERIVTAEPDGKYLLNYDSRMDSVSLVMIGTSEKDSLVMHTPDEGDDIGSMATGVKYDSVKEQYILPSSLYYGVYNYTSHKSVNNITWANIVLINKPVTVRVVIRQLKETFGEGPYRVVLSGFRNFMSFTGESKGDSITYSPKFKFDMDDQLVTDAVRSLPSMIGEHLTVSVYKSQSGKKSESRISGLTSQQLLISADRDETGKYVSLCSGDNKVVIIDFNSKNITMSVIPWNEYIRNIVIP